jgi:hypothetical protein
MLFAAVTAVPNFERTSIIGAAFLVNDRAAVKPRLLSSLIWRLAYAVAFALLAAAILYGLTVLALTLRAL